MEDIIKLRRIQNYTNGKRIINKLENRRISVFADNDKDSVIIEFKRLLTDTEMFWGADLLLEQQRNDTVTLKKKIINHNVHITKEAAKVLIDTLMHLVYPEVMEKE